MLTENEILTWLEQIRVSVAGQAFTFRLAPKGSGWTLQSEIERPDAYTGIREVGRSGKRYISPHATKDEVVKGALACCLTWVEHEIRETFLFDGKRLFGPHIPIEALMSVADETTFREPGPSASLTAPEEEKETVRHTVVCQRWSESERGVGQRRTGWSLHLSVQDRKQYVDNWYDEQPDWNGLAAAPDLYEFPHGAPFPLDVTAEGFEEVKRSSGGLRVWEDLSPLMAPEQGPRSGRRQGYQAHRCPIIRKPYRRP